MCNEEHAAGIDKAVFPGIQGGPLEHIIAGKAIALLEASKPEFKIYAQQIVKNAQALANGLMGEAMDIVGGCTENHLMTQNSIHTFYRTYDSDNSSESPYLSLQLCL